jgi:hypothetical protein
MQAERELFEFVRALDAPPRLACRLDRGQQECDQQADDRDHDQ